MKKYHGQFSEEISGSSKTTLSLQDIQMAPIIFER